MQIQAANIVLQSDNVRFERKATVQSSTTALSERRVVATEPLPDNDRDTSLNQGLDANTYKLKALVEALTGKPIELASERLQSAQKDADGRINSPAIRQNTATVTEQIQRRESIESTAFQASGELLTSDDQRLFIDYSFLLERQELEITRTTAETAQLIDPLTLTLDSAIPQLTATPISFDLDSDGNIESIAFASGQSAFIALDRNDNGQLDNGSELFGPVSGNGFAELAVYDEDNNGFIDSGDAVFRRLSLAQADENNRINLTPLSSQNIGALYLGNVATPFELRASNQALQGVIRASSFYLRENGRPGALQHVDLAV